jgi:hypothetical protein
MTEIIQGCGFTYGLISMCQNLTYKTIDNALNADTLSLRARRAWQSHSLGIAEPVPSEVRNLRVCFGYASQLLRSSQ